MHPVRVAAGKSIKNVVGHKKSNPPNWLVNALLYDKFHQKE